MAGKIQWGQAFWQEWKNNPEATAKKYGLNWNEMQGAWQNVDWQNTSMDEFEKMWKRSKWAGWINW